MKIINLRSNTILKENYNNVELSIFYSKYIDIKTYPNLRNIALKIMFLFGSRYLHL